jgi:hypothetical protein
MSEKTSFWCGLKFGALVKRLAKTHNATPDSLIFFRVKAFASFIDLPDRSGRESTFVGTAATATPKFNKLENPFWLFFRQH